MNRFLLPIRLAIILLILIIFPSNGNSKSSPWPLFISAITSSYYTLNHNPLWGVYTDTWCPSGDLYFIVTISGVTRQSKSVLAVVGSTWEGFVETTQGTKSVDVIITSSGTPPGCGPFSKTYEWTFEKGYFYLFQLELRDRYFVVVVYSGMISMLDLSNQNMRTDSPSNDIEKIIKESTRKVILQTNIEAPNHVLE